MRQLMLRLGDLGHRGYRHARGERLRTLAPGASLCVVIALAAAYVAGFQGGPPMLYGLAFGAAFHFQSHDARTAAGVDLCMRSVLRLGIGLLGARITAAQVAGLGWPVGLVTLAAVASTIACGVLVARWLGASWRLGVLAGGATAICGAAAALAIASVLPRDPGKERDTLAVVVLATMLSTAATLLYPVIAHALALSPTAAGVFIGATMHDVAQVVVAGYAMGHETGDVATVVKLLRVSLLTVVVVGVTLVARRNGASEGAAPARSFALPVPGFLWLFAAFVGVRSSGLMPAHVQATIVSASTACLMVGVTALGMKTSFGGLARAGWRPIALMVCATAWLAAFVLVAIRVLGLG